MNLLVFKGSNRMRCGAASLLFAVFICMGDGVFGQSSQTFSTPGTYTFTVPAGISNVQVECWGSAGAGGGATTSNPSAGGGGSGGAYTKNASISVNSLGNYTVVVGSGGTGNTSTGASGEASWFGSTTTLKAVGGLGGAGGTTTTSANGAAAVTSGNIGGTVNYYGGAGAKGTSGAASGGGGGGSAGTGSAGNAGGTSGVGATGGSAVTGGAAGASYTTSNANGNAGGNPGGGGSGARRTSGSRSGGNGGNGQVKITWSCPTYSISSTTISSTTIYEDNSATVNVYSSTLATGIYTVTYNLSSPNASTGNTTTMNFTEGSPGTGSFTTLSLGNSGTTTVTISNLSSGTSPQNCSNAISSNNTATVVTIPASGTQTFTSSGSFTAPFCTNLKVETWGGGGGGGGAATSNSATGGGGGGGAYQLSPSVAVVGGTSYTVTVGAGGDPGSTSGTSGGTGGSSSFNGGTVAVGGSGGGGSTSSTVGSSGAAGTGTHNGGAGASGAANSGGGGGGSAGTTANGGNGNTNGTAGTAGVSLGGNGGAGNTSSSGGAGSNGSVPGGGGGGARRETGNGNVAGGTGGAGKVILTWSCPMATITYEDSPYCKEATSGTVTLTGNTCGTYSATPSGLSINASSGTINPSSSTAGTYTVHYQIAANGGCNAVDATASVVISASLSVSAGSAFTKTCTSNTSGAAIGEANDATATYAWTPSSGLSSTTVSNPTANPTTTTTYTVTKTKTASGCTATATVTVTVNTTTTSVSAGSAFTKTCTSNTSGAAIGEANDATATYAWSPSSGLSSTTVSNPTANPTTTTTYTVTKTKTASGCTATATVTVTVNTTTTSVSAGSAFTKTCTSNTSGAAIGEANDATATYAWTPSSGLSSTTVSNPTANPTTTTTYTVTKTKTASGCTATATVTVTVNTTTTSVSAGSAFTKSCTSNASGAAIGESNDATATYTWSPSSGLSSTTVSNPTANPTTTTTYTVTKTKTASGCTATATVTVTVNNTAPSVSAGSPFTKTCTSNTSGAAIGEANDATATYAWTPSSGLSSTTVSNPTANPTTTTTYTVTKTKTASGCTATATITVTVNMQLGQPAAFTSSSSDVCSGQNAVAFVVPNDNSVTYNWSYSGSGATINGTTNSVTVDFNDSATSGTLSVTAANGCGTSSARTIAINVKSVPVPATAILGSFVVCPGTQAVVYSVQAVPGATSYQWTIPPYGGVTLASGQGTSSVTLNFDSNWKLGPMMVNTANACGVDTIATSIYIRSIPHTPSGLTGPDVVCSNNSGINYSFTPAPEYDASYTWSTPPGVSITSGAGTSSIMASFDTTWVSGNISVYATNVCGSSTASIFGVKSTPASLNVISGSSQLCKNSTTSYSVSETARALSYLWIVPTGISIVSGQGSNVINVSTSSTWNTGSISVKAMNECGSSASRTMAIKSVTPVAGAIAGSTGICPNNTGSYSIVSVSGITYSWTAPSGMSITSGQGSNEISVATNNAWVSGSLTVTASNGCGASPAKALSLKSVLPKVPGAILTIGGTTKVCPGDSRTFSIADVANASSYTWTLPTGASITGRSDTTSISVTFGNNFTATGNLCVVANNPCGSSAGKCLSLVLNNPSTPGAVTVSNGIAKVCPGESRTYSIATVANANSYTWSIPSGTAGVNINNSGTSYSGTQTSVPVNFTSDFSSTSVVLSVIATNGCGSSAVRNLTVGRNAASTPGAIVGVTSACPNTTGNEFSIPVVANATSYLWTSPSGSVINNQGSNKVTIDFATTFGAITVASVNGCGNSPAKSKSIAKSKSCVSLLIIQTDKNEVSQNLEKSPETTNPKTPIVNTETKIIKTETKNNLTDLQEPKFDVPNAFNLQVYPDAEERNITFTFNADKAGIFKYKIVDPSDNELLRGKIKAIEGVNMEQVDLSSLPKTVFTLKLEDDTTSTHVNVTMQ